MKVFPWRHRVEKEHHLRVAAEQQLAETKADWPRIHQHAAELRREKDLNGWTGIVAGLFADRKEA